MSDFIRLGTVSFAFGAVLLLLALVGGGLSVKEVSLNQLNNLTRVLLASVGAVFIGIGLWVTLQDQPLTGAGIEANAGGPPKPSDAATSTSLASSAATTTTIASFPTVAERELLAHVPEEFRSRCQRDDEAPYEGQLASVECTPKTGAATVWFVQYKKTDDMKKWYYDHIDSKNLKQDFGDCQKDQVEEFTYDVSKVTSGRYACYRDGAKTWIIWFHEKLRILALAYRGDTNAAKLKQWWINAGPF
jgi:hypothetical protein